MPTDEVMAEQRGYDRAIAEVVAMHRTKAQSLHERAVVEGDKVPADSNEPFFRHLVMQSAFHVAAATAIEAGEHKP